MKKNIDFIGKRKVFFIISAILVMISLGSLVINGLNFGIDFKGGTIIQIEMHQSFDTNEVRVVTDQFDKNADITYAGDDKTQLIMKTQNDMSTEQIYDLFNQMKEKFNLKDENPLSSGKLSASIGAELRNQALLASAIAVILMMIYISIRFKLTYGIAAVIALAHDVIIVLGVYSLFKIQVNSPFIAAILTILGYSVNDTIVVFDRIRENSKKYKKNQNAALINDSVNQTMARSINTTLTTLLAISALYVTGVQAIQDFTLPLIIGFISGAYSSIFIANPIWYLLQERKNAKAVNN